MDNPEDFKSLQDQIQMSLVFATRTAGQISSEDLGFQRSLNPAIGTALDEQSARLLILSSSLLKSAASLGDIDTPLLQDTEDVDNNWRGVVDVVDSLLEKADTCLDEYTGIIKRKTPPTTEQPPAKLKKYQSLGNSFKTQNLIKPQLAFQYKPDNFDVTSWKPLITSKPHASISLADSLGIFTDELGHQQYKHPYETEIRELQYPDAIYRVAEPITYLPIESTKATFVDTFNGVLAMLDELRAADEIAVDLEHHDARSYVGLVSLMQISTREKDWIVDTLKPWRQDLQVLNEVFTDPKIIKVFHGAYMDIVWLQRDLGLYITGLFDTHHASRVLGYPGGSLAYLLKRFIDFDADKKYQMADWRIRPLPDEMFFYARADTHFLLYIYDNLRNELVEKSTREIPEENRIELVLQKSKETSLQRFERQIYDENSGRGPGGWYPLLVKTPALLSNEQFAVFRAVHAWRDQIARKDDDSTSYVMPNHAIFTLAKLMPEDMVSLYGAVHPISHNIKSRTAELLAIIKSAKFPEKGGPSMMEMLRPDSMGAMAKANHSSAKQSQVKRMSEEPPKKISSPGTQGQLRSDKSAFWGGAFGSSIWDLPSYSASTGTDLKLAIPLPQVFLETLVEVSSNLADCSRPPQDHVPGDYIKGIKVNEKRDALEEEPFIIKTGKKRKVRDMETKLMDSEEPSGEYDISLNDEEDEKARDKVARKAERKAQKKLEKTARNLARGGGVATATAEGDNEEAFDYSKADSVLHGKNKESGTNGVKRQKPFDPYAKSSDAPKDMRKAQTEQAGKSFTFKS